MNKPLNGTSAFALTAGGSLESARNAELAQLRAGTQALAVLSTGLTKVQSLALKVAKGEVTAEQAFALLKVLP